MNLGVQFGDFPTSLLGFKVEFFELSSSLLALMWAWSLAIWLGVRGWSTNFFLFMKESDLISMAIVGGFAIKLPRPSQENMTNFLMTISQQPFPNKCTSM